MIETESLKINELEQGVVKKTRSTFLRTSSSFSFTQYLKPKSAFVPLKSVAAPRIGPAHGRAYGCLSPAPGKALRAILVAEQKRALDVLGVKVARRWRNWGA
ncbi:MAG TPA: hypothetical protein VH598_09965 [Verrucomicrobiae bacterium]|nr:hypothetical protein [Verrucomicrobiae bacterium]